MTEDLNGKISDFVKESLLYFSGLTNDPKLDPKKYVLYYVSFSDILSIFYITSHEHKKVIIG